MNALVPGPTPKRTLFLSTGAEAVENAIKIARAHTGRSGTIAFKGGFHYRTMMGMALTGKVVPYKTGFGPFRERSITCPSRATIWGERGRCAGCAGSLLQLGYRAGPGGRHHHRAGAG